LNESRIGELAITPKLLAKTRALLSHYSGADQAITGVKDWNGIGEGSILQAIVH